MEDQVGKEAFTEDKVAIKIIIKKDIHIDIYVFFSWKVSVLEAFPPLRQWELVALEDLSEFEVEVTAKVESTVPYHKHNTVLTQEL